MQWRKSYSNHRIKYPQLLNTTTYKDTSETEHDIGMEQ